MNDIRISRRAFIRQGSLVMASTFFGCRLALGEAPPSLCFGLITDVHYANKPASGSRFYQEALGKMREAVSKFQEAKASFAIELGDLIDAAPTAEEEINWLRTIDAEYTKFGNDRHYVVGNHCVWTLTKKQFLDTVGLKAGHYSFDKGEFHFVVLDACYRADGVEYGAKNFTWDNTDIPAVERDWLAQDLKTTTKPTVVFVHQRLDTADKHTIHGAPSVRKILEDSGKVLAVFQGHQHINDHKEINGIHYCTMMASIEGTGVMNNAYALVNIQKDGTIVVEGFRKQKDYTLSPTNLRRKIE